MNSRHFRSVASHQWNGLCHRPLKALLASPNALMSSFSFSSASSSTPIGLPERKISKAGDEHLSVVSIMDRFLQSGNVIKQSKSSVPFGSLTLRIFKERDPSRSMVSILDEWTKRGLKVNLTELHNLTKKLRQQCRFSDALQIAEWMADRRDCDLLAKHFAVQLDLISKVHGLEKAEEFFSSIPDCSKDYHVCVVLLICFANAKQLEKAEALMQKMRDMDIKTAYAYNVMLNLYSKMGKYEKLDVLIQEMEEKGIKLDMFTFEIKLHAYGALGDIEGMEKFLTKINMDSEFKMSFRAYTFAAYGYLKAGLIDKALTSLKDSEQLVTRNLKRYEKLLPLYAATGNKAEVYRVWNLYKQFPRYYKTGYVTMISSLLMLDDMDGAEKIWEEWDSSKLRFDIRVPNLMIRGYSRKGIWEKAEEYINKIIERGEKPNVGSWDGLVAGYILGGRMLEAVETIKKAISTSIPGRNPSMHTLAASLKFLEGQCDKEAAEDLRKMINKHCHLSSEEYNRLSHLVKDEKLTCKAVVLQMEDDQISVKPRMALDFPDKRSEVFF